jgi:putative NIF3 family GTP cyclohydrolase 1 type 2
MTLVGDDLHANGLGNITDPFADAAIAAGAQVYITGEARYHDLFNYDGRILMAVIGHYESEQYTIDIFKDVIAKACPQVRVVKTTVNTNPVNYL